MAKEINLKDKQNNGKEQTHELNEPKMGGKGTIGGGKGNK